MDLIFSNAALQWLPDHGTLFPRLMRQVGQGGVLAVQMPNQNAAPSHMAIDETIKAAPWRAETKAALIGLRRPAIAAQQDYYDWLAPLAHRVDQWETLYTHVLGGAPPGSSAVAEWTQSTSLKPVLDALEADAARRAWFWAEYCRRTDAAYPRRADGTTLFPFRRLFTVAVRE